MAAGGDRALRGHDNQPDQKPTVMPLLGRDPGAAFRAGFYCCADVSDGRAGGRQAPRSSLIASMAAVPAGLRPPALTVGLPA
jgi:hypothetical protein